MTNEDRYKECLLHVINWVGGTNEYSHLQPMAGRNTYRIARIVDAVVGGMTTLEALQLTEPQPIYQRNADDMGMPPSNYGYSDIGSPNK
jgi:hypothetical protein